MIIKIQGILESIKPTFSEVWAGGLCYKVQTTLKTSTELINQHKEVGSENPVTITLFTILVIKEKSHELWGFLWKEERETFKLLCSVSGVGANTARLILSKYSSSEVEQLILMEDVAAFSKAKGLGPKTAKRVILELKDKLVKQGKLSDRVVRHSPQKENHVRMEAIDGLIALGYKLISAQKAVNGVLRKGAVRESSDLIRKALKSIG